MTDQRPPECCGVCPPIVGGGYDCTCKDNPRCDGPKEGMTMADYAYDPDLPYVVTMGDEVLSLVARFRSEWAAKEYVYDLGSKSLRIIDTTPKPRVPDDAKYIAWTGLGDRWIAERTSNGWEVAGYGLISAIGYLPGVTPDTVFIVLDERKNDD